MDQAVEPICAGYKKDIQHGYDQDVADRGDRATQGGFYTLSYRLEGCDIAGVEVVEIGFQQMRHCGGDRAIAKNERLYLFGFALRCGVVKLECDDQHEEENYKVMEEYGVEAEVVGGELLHCLRGVDKVGIDRG